ncbi:MAG TPA: hypothetical protein VJ001_11990 [Rhodocyclaceae bacterium]|nr:hypothetical protein [Rhodocyclaceae bacterium]
MSEVIPRGTSAHNPDLDWSQVRETVLMLELSVGQIEGAMKDSNSSVEVLTDTFTTMAGYMSMMSDAIVSLPDDGAAGETKEKLQGAANHVTGMVHQSIIAFQFYDKLVQRLAHVNHSLAELASLVTDNGRLYNPGEWKALQGKIRSKYSMKEEQAMFEAVMRGVPVKQALEQFMHDMKGKQDDDIELF